MNTKHLKNMLQTKNQCISSVIIDIVIFIRSTLANVESNGKMQFAVFYVLIVEDFNKNKCQVFNLKM